MSASPPSPLRAALGGRAPKQPWVDWLFTRVARRYDVGNDLMSAGWHTRWKHRLVDLAAPEAHETVLDLACGTGDVAWRMAEVATPASITGCDINPAMLSLAEAKRRSETGTPVTFEVADAQALPFGDASFDLVTCGYAGRGFPSWPAVLAEVFRVLKPGGRFINLDFARPPNRLWDATYRAYMTAAGAMWGTLVHGDPRTYVYIAESMRTYAGQRWLEAQLRQAGFVASTIETRACLMAYNLGTKPS